MRSIDGRQAGERAVGSADQDDADTGQLRKALIARSRIVLLSAKAGLRAGEIAQLTWSMVTNADGSVGDVIQIEDGIAKRRSGRTMPMNPGHRDALIELNEACQPTPTDTVIYSNRGSSMSAGSVTIWLRTLYRRLGFQGAYFTLRPPHIRDTGGT